MTTVLSIDVAERTIPNCSSTDAALTVRRWEGDELPPADVQISISRTLPAHLLRHALEVATEQLCADQPTRIGAYERRPAA